MKKLTVILVICLCLALAAGFASGTAVVQGSGASAVAAKGGNGGGGGSTGGKVDPTAATLQFRDFRGDQIQSDGLGSYAGQVQQNYPDQEILLNSYSKVGRGLTRYLSFGELDAEPTNECPLTGQTNAGFKDTPTLAIIHGGDAPVGQARPLASRHGGDPRQLALLLLLDQGIRRAAARGASRA